MEGVNVCPNCTEFEVTPRVIMPLIKIGYKKFKCPKCCIEFEYRVTKEPDYENFDKDINN